MFKKVHVGASTHVRIILRSECPRIDRLTSAPAPTNRSVPILLRANNLVPVFPSLELALGSAVPRPLALHRFSALPGSAIDPHSSQLSAICPMPFCISFGNPETIFWCLKVLGSNMSAMTWM